MMFGLKKPNPLGTHRTNQPCKTERMPLSSANERKMMESITHKSSSSAGDALKTPMRSLSVRDQPSKTENKQPHRSMVTPKQGNTPKKGLTPRRHESFVGDRFIPNRNTTQIALGQYLMSRPKSESDDVFLSPATQNYRKAMNENLNGDIMSRKIIGYHQQPPENDQAAALRAVYSSSKVLQSSKRVVRHIPQAPEKVLDAPELIDDYYLNLLDWSSQNILAVCLGPCVYVWNATSGEIKALVELEDSNEYPSSVAWVKGGAHLAVGASTGELQLWDVERQKRMRTMPGHVARVGALSWNDHLLSSGSRSGFINHHDVRVAKHLVSSVNAHSQEVCGLKWSPDGKYLASGGNDNTLNIFSNQLGQSASDQKPIYSFSDHNAAVKALAWCPWQSSLLASGGGTADQHIMFWNCNTGTNLSRVNTKSQVCSLLWSEEYQELVSSHGFEFHQITLWSYPKMEKITELKGHSDRVLHMAMSPDGSIVASAGADEILNLWKCFAVDPKKKKAVTKRHSPSTAFRTIR